MVGGGMVEELIGERRGQGWREGLLVFGAGTAYTKLFGFRSRSTSMCLKVLKNGAWADGEPPPSRSAFFSPLLPDLWSHTVAWKNIRSPIKVQIIPKSVDN